MPDERDRELAELRATLRAMNERLLALDERLARLEGPRPPAPSAAAPPVERRGSSAGCARSSPRATRSTSWAR
jgi:hypothetical protein